MNKFVTSVALIATVFGPAAAFADTYSNTLTSASSQQAASPAGAVSALHSQVRALKEELAVYQGLSPSRVPHANTNFQGSDNAEIARLEAQSKVLSEQIGVAREAAKQHSVQTKIDMDALQADD